MFGGENPLDPPIVDWTLFVYHVRTPQKVDMTQAHSCHTETAWVGQLVQWHGGKQKDFEKTPTA